MFIGMSRLAKKVLHSFILYFKFSFQCFPKLLRIFEAKFGLQFISDYKFIIEFFALYMPAIAVLGLITG